MTDNALAILFRAQLRAGLSRAGYAALPVVASYQPTTQGRVNGPAIYFHPISDTRYGWQWRKRKYNPLTGRIDTTEAQIIESAFQVYALAEQDPSNLELPTAKDFTNIAAMICNSENFMQSMRANGAGILRVTQIRSPFFVNDEGQFEASPSFDITISHPRQLQEVTPVAADVTHFIHRV